MNEIFDLHLHTIFSDGEYTPNEIIKMALELGAKYISFTDHDSINAYKNITVKSDLKIIKGCEFTTKLDGQGLHILGYGINFQSAELARYFDSLTQTKFERLKIYQKVLENNDLHLPNEFYDYIYQNNYGISASRIVYYMQENNYLFDRKAIYDEMMTAAINVKKPFKNAYDIIGLIHNADGLAFLAHPNRYHLNYAEIENVTANLKNAGLDGLELYNSATNSTNLAFLQNLSIKYDLLTSGGSDFHSEKYTDRSLVNFYKDAPLDISNISKELFQEKNYYKIWFCFNGVCREIRERNENITEKRDGKKRWNYTCSMIFINLYKIAK